VLASSFEDPTVIVSLITTTGALLAIILTGLFARRQAADAKNDRDAQTEKLSEIHLLVNSRMDEALKRVLALEAKLGLQAGEDIPAPAIVTMTTVEPPPEVD